MYTITIKQNVKPEGQANDIDRTVFEQKTEELDVQAVIAVVNGLEKPKPTEPGK